MRFVFMHLGLKLGVYAVHALVVFFPVMILWNAVIPEVTDAQTLDPTQAYAVCLISAMLFKSFPNVRLDN